MVFVLNCNITTPEMRSVMCKVIAEKASKAPQFKPLLLHLEAMQDGAHTTSLDLRFPILKMGTGSLRHAKFLVLHLAQSGACRD